MRSHLIVINRVLEAGQYLPLSRSELTDTWALWQTCVRSMAISEDQASLTSIKESLLSTDEIYQGKEAYQFLLEVVCGLHSPVTGETEVHGQFKEFVDGLSESHSLTPILRDMHLKARKVRDAHLRGLGSQSYGSLARRRVRGFNRVCLLGVGQLAREILPWLAKLDLEVVLFSRKPEKHHDLVAKYPRVNLRHFDEEKDLKDVALIISAPLNSSRISEWMGNQAHGPRLILDYRGESHFDPLKTSIDYLNLKDIFKEIDNTKQKVDAEVGRAKLFISSLCN